ncbi:L,D-transpeptidase [Synechococcus sp. ATX 2A4]|nr:L,D-transpeptidase [Synechococcus sp. ATX 2A4]
MGLDQDRQKALPLPLVRGRCRVSQGQSWWRTNARSLTAAALVLAATPPALAAPLAGVPAALVQRPDRHLVLQRRQRRLLVLEAGELIRTYPVAVGMPGWDTPVGRFEVLNMQVNPVWEHPAKGTRIGPGPANPLGSRWIGFQKDCSGRRGVSGDQVLDLQGCLMTGFHGTPHRWTVGRAVSHGCVRLHDESVQELYGLVQVGTSVTVLP